MTILKPIVLFIVLSITVFQHVYAQSSSSSAEPVPGARTVHSAPYEFNPAINRAFQCPTASENSVKKPISDFAVMGMPFPESVRIVGCVVARTDGEARSRCGNNFSVINPENPQYTIDGKGQRGSNNVENGYYYCIPALPGTITMKAELCRAAIARENLNTDSAHRFDIVWSSPTTSLDGDCLCRPLGSTQPYDFRCPENRTVDVTDNTRIITAATAELNSTDASLPTNVVNDVTAKINQCIARWRGRANSCKTRATELERSCASTNQQNSLVENASEGLGAIGQVNNAARAGQGVYASCFKTGALVLGARELLNTARQRCEGGEIFCRSDCNTTQTDQMLQDCSNEAGVADLNQLQNDHPQMYTTLTTAKDEIKSTFEEGALICSTDVSERRGSLSRITSDLSNTLQTASVCACKTSSAGSQNCDTIPNISVCERNANTPGCGAYVPVSSCAVGSVGYDQKTCACIQNPNTPGCAQLNGGQGPPSFANLNGNALPLASAGTGSGGVSFGGGSSGKASGGNFGDLSSGNTTDVAATNFANNLKAGDTSAGNSSGGGGGGGSAAAASGGGNGPLTELPGGVPIPEKGLGGVFSQIKNSIANAFGSNSKRAGGPKEKVAGQPDLSKFKPKLRGGTAQREIASANEKTLFELVNECANGLRCNEMQKSFLVEP